MHSSIEKYVFNTLIIFLHHYSFDFLLIFFTQFNYSRIIEITKESASKIKKSSILPLFIVISIEHLLHHHETHFSIIVMEVIGRKE